MNTDKLIFPENFLWGAATSSYQIEGAYTEDGKCESIWDRFSHTAGNVFQNHNGDIACDHYHRYKEDVNLMKFLGLKSYRFSTAWPRIFTDGKSKINQKGIDFYNRLVDELVKNNIKPFITLYHWDLPQVLEDSDGWLNRDTGKYYLDYVNVVVEALKDRVKHWFTFNEIIWFVLSGYGKGKEGCHAPGKKYGLKQINQIRHNVLVAHGNAVRAIKNIDENLKIGIAHAPQISVPVDEYTSQLNNMSRIFKIDNDPIFAPLYTRQYPNSLLEMWGDAAPDIDNGELDIISTPVDIIGLNIYSSKLVRLNQDTNDIELVDYPADYPRTLMGWPVNGDSMYWGVKMISELYYSKEIYITENGASFDDKLDKDNKIHDIYRINFLKEYLTNLHKSISEGINVKGYFLWSLMDNFEWAHGYKEKFGIIYIDRNNDLKRIIKDSGYWYKEVINGVVHKS